MPTCAICVDRKPYLLVEAKAGKPDVSAACHRFAAELGVPCAITTVKANVARRLPAAGSPGIVQISAGRHPAPFPRIKDVR